MSDSISGNIASDLELTHVGDIPKVSFRIARSSWKTNKETGERVAEPSLFFTVEAWRTLAVNLHQSMRKGMPVIISGDWNASEWTDKDGNERRRQFITAKNAGPDLSRCSAVVTYERKGAAPPAAPGAESAVEAPNEDADPFEVD